MKIEVIEMSRKLYQASEIVPPLSRAILFGGERWRGITHGAIAIDGGLVIGLATMRVLPSHAEIEGVWVEEFYRRSGYGTALCEALVEFYEELAPSNPIDSQAVTASGWALLQSVQRKYPEFKVRNYSVAGFELP